MPMFIIKVTMPSGRVYHAKGHRGGPNPKLYTRGGATQYVNRWKHNFGQPRRYDEKVEVIQVHLLPLAINGKEILP